jgi:hypothetical protein
MNSIAPYWKAVVGFIAPGAVILTYAVTADSAGGDFVTTGELVTALCACVITGAGVYSKSNRP